MSRFGQGACCDKYKHFAWKRAALQQAVQNLIKLSISFALHDSAYPHWSVVNRRSSFTHFATLSVLRFIQSVLFLLY